MKNKSYRYGIGPFWNFVNRWNFTQKQVKRFIFYIELRLTATEIFRLIRHNNKRTADYLAESQVKNFLYNSRKQEKL